MYNIHMRKTICAEGLHFCAFQCYCIALCLKLIIKSLSLSNIRTCGWARRACTCGHCNVLYMLYIMLRVHCTGIIHVYCTCLVSLTSDVPGPVHFEEEFQFVSERAPQFTRY